MRKREENLKTEFSCSLMSSFPLKKVEHGNSTEKLKKISY